MRAPVTSLDRRFSDEDAVATSWEETRRVLEDAQLSWITTVRADGRPHVSPLVAVWPDEAPYFATGAEEQKAVNLRTNPHVVLTTGCNGWESGLDVLGQGSGFALAFRVVPSKVLAFGKGSFSHTRHDFAG